MMLWMLWKMVMEKFLDINEAETPPNHPFLTAFVLRPNRRIRAFPFYDGCTVFFSSFTAHWSMGSGYPQWGREATLRYTISISYRSKARHTAFPALMYLVNAVVMMLVPIPNVCGLAGIGFSLAAEMTSIHNNISYPFHCDMWMNFDMTDVRFIMQQEHLPFCPPFYSVTEIYSK